LPCQHSAIQISNISEISKHFAGGEVKGVGRESKRRKTKSIKIYHECENSILTLKKV
jgi:hypothetical protein